jgi:hypothetical protein
MLFDVKSIPTDFRRMELIRIAGRDDTGAETEPHMCCVKLTKAENQCRPTGADYVSRLPNLY